ncbi:MAG TPA: hypothetical protein VJG30_02100 [Candidatus Nanoarchaeia archaeon]|nr:hypothetical protein [Candidatus Nanoarchaeia archaeon]
MEKINESVFDAGPFIHLEEINKLDLTKLFKEILTTKEILEECKNILKEIEKLNNIKSTELKPQSKDFAKYIIEKYNLDIGEATGIALCKQENIKLFFTDDLEAREITNSLGFEAHGTLAIILRSYKEKLLSKKEAENSIEELYNNSSLFFTKDLMEWTIKEIRNFKH